MCCMICSRRGITYFGVYIHLLTGLLILPLVTLTAAYSIGPYGTGRDFTSFDVTFMAIYTVGTLFLGFIIFKAVRNESLLLLKLSTIFLIIFQSTALIITVLSWKSKIGSASIDMIMRIGSIALNCFATIVYVIILILFIRHVSKKKNDSEKSTDEDAVSLY